MEDLNYYVVDAFADALFRGNPAGVCVLDRALPDELMQRIAAENNLSETAFLRREGERYALRWFTPTFEIDLCGHATLAAALGVTPVEAYAARDLCVLLEDQRAVEDYVPNYDRLLALKDWMGIAVTARGTDADFVSRFFCPELRLEDPVTGSSHSSLAPLWGEKLGKTRLEARQLSRRGGALLCELEKNTVKISGAAVLYLRGRLTI